MTLRSRPTSQWIILGGVTLPVLLIVIAGLATKGWPGGILMAGLALLLVGLGAVIVGRARWAFITSRKIATAVAAAGLVAIVVGAATAPSVTSRPPSARDTTSPSPSADEAAIETAENALAIAEFSEAAGPDEAHVDTTTGRFTDSAANDAIRAAPRTSALAALAALAAIDVKGPAPLAGYDRSQFGSNWTDTAGNACDTRDTVLARDLTSQTSTPATSNCVVQAGTLADPYSGRTINFQRGANTSDAVQIDHVMALADAWQKGAQNWDTYRRTAFPAFRVIRSG